jgi:hypothetical protein
MEISEQPIFPGFEAESRCCPQVYPASRLPWPGSDEARTMTAGSGRQCSMLFETSNPLGAFSRILLESLAWTNSEEYSYVWNRLDTRFALSAFQLTPLGPSTDDNGCSLWRSPTGTEDNGGGANGQDRLAQGHALRLRDQVKTPALWPSPTAGDAKASGSRNTPQSNAHGGESLTDRARGDGGMGRLWPTPIERDWKSTSHASKDNSRPLSEVAGLVGKLWPTPREANARQCRLESHHIPATSGSLNPRFVEELMGFRIEHTALKHSETRSSRSKPTRSFGRSRLLTQDSPPSSRSSRSSRSR